MIASATAEFSAAGPYAPVLSVSNYSSGEQTGGGNAFNSLLSFFSEIPASQDEQTVAPYGVATGNSTLTTAYRPYVASSGNAALPTLPIFLNTPATAVPKMSRKRDDANAATMPASPTPIPAVPVTPTIGFAFPTIAPPVTQTSQNQTADLPANSTTAPKTSRGKSSMLAGQDQRKAVAGLGAAPIPTPVSPAPASPTLAEAAPANLTKQNQLSSPQTASAPESALTQPNTPVSGHLAFALRVAPNDAPHSMAAPSIEPTSEPIHAAQNSPVAPVAQATSDKKHNPDSGSNSGADDNSQPRTYRVMDSASAATPGHTDAPAVPSAPIPTSIPVPVNTHAAQQSAPAPATSVPVATSAPLAPTTPEEPVKTGAANRISLSVTSDDNQKVEVRLMDRGGEVRVSVRTPNEDLAGNLREDIGSLTTRLNQNGYTTEAFAPAHSDMHSADHRSSTPDQQQSSNTGQNPDGGRQDNKRGRRPAWLDELENKDQN